MWRLERFRFLFLVCCLIGLAILWEVTDPDYGSDQPQTELDAHTTVFNQTFPGHPDARYRWTKSLIEKDDLEGARRTLEDLIDGGVISSEMVLYDYAIVLIQLKADRKEINAAIENWQKHFPRSEQRDPRLLLGRESVDGSVVD